MDRKLKFIIFFVGWLVCLDALAVPAKKGVHTVVQPDGSTIEVILCGDEHFNYVMDTDSAILCMDSGGFYRKADAGYVERLKSRVTGHRERTMRGGLNDGEVPTTGTLRGLVILAEFTDMGFDENNGKEHFQRLLNEEGYSDNGATGSVRDYYADQSYGLFTPEFDVAGPVRLSGNMEYYGGDKGDGIPYNAYYLARSVGQGIAVLIALAARHKTYKVYRGIERKGDEQHYYAHVYYVQFGGVFAADNGGAVGKRFKRFQAAHGVEQSALYVQRVQHVAHCVFGAHRRKYYVEPLIHRKHCKHERKVGKEEQKRLYNAVRALFDYALRAEQNEHGCAGHGYVQVSGHRGVQSGIPCRKQIQQRKYRQRYAFDNIGVYNARALCLFARKHGDEEYYRQHGHYKVYYQQQRGGVEPFGLGYKGGQFPAAESGFGYYRPCKHGVDYGGDIPNQHHVAHGDILPVAERGYEPAGYQQYRRRGVRRNDGGFYRFLLVCSRHNNSP